MWKAGLLYFATVFGAGLVLGPIRVLWAAPRFGERAAELAEAPIMLVVIALAARWVVRRPGVSRSTKTRLEVGLLALVILVAAEIGVVLAVRRVSIAQYLASRDPVSGGVYAASLALFAIMPLLVGSPRPAKGADRVIDSAARRSR